MLLTAPDWLETSRNETLATMRAVGVVVYLRVFRRYSKNWEWITECGGKGVMRGWSRSRSEAMRMARLAAHALTIPLYASASRAHPRSPTDTGVLAFERKSRSPATIASLPARGIEAQPDGFVA
jgi:hypothetical protein